MSDEDLAPKSDEIAAQDSVETLFRSEGPRLARFFRFRAIGGVDPGDLVQEAFARFLGRARRGVPDNPAAYLHRIARNLLYEQTRRQRVRAPYEQEADPDADIPVPPPQVQQMETNQLMERFQGAVGRLPRRMREVFTLHRMEEMTCRQIAEKLEIGVRTVEWHLGEALIRIRCMMDDE